MEEIFRSDKILQFWPTEKQSAKERTYATTRFILYLSCILYIIRRDPRILVMGALALSAVYYMYKNGMIKEPSNNVVVQKPVQGNVMNNVTIAGPGVAPTAPDRRSVKETWDSIHPFMEGRWFSEYNFYTVPEDDAERFLQNTYPNMMAPVCRDNPAFCNVEGSMARGPEWIQRKTFERL